MENQIMPKWLVNTLGVLLIVFVAILIVQKGNDVKNTFENKKPTNTMSVSAEGKVSAAPDLATVTIGVMTQGTDAVAVKNDNNSKVGKIVDFLKKQGIDEKDINTSQYYFYPQQDYSNGQTRITGYQGNQTITVKVHQLEKNESKLEAIMDGSVNVGANQIQGVAFTFEDPNELQQQARKDAIEKAKIKAQELAQEAGLTLGKVVSVSENSGYMPGPIPYASDAYGMGGGGMASSKSIAPSIERGSQDITQTMTVVFEVK